MQQDLIKLWKTQMIECRLKADAVYLTKFWFVPYKMLVLWVPWMCSVPRKRISQFETEGRYLNTLS